METVKNYLTLKEELKQLAIELKALKPWTNHSKKRICRHKHIAYSMMRGRTYEQIEAKCRKGNSPDQNLIQEIIRAYGTTDVCVGAA